MGRRHHRPLRRLTLLAAVVAGTGACGTDPPALVETVADRDTPVSGALVCAEDDVVADTSFEPNLPPQLGGGSDLDPLEEVTRAVDAWGFDFADLELEVEGDGIVHHLVLRRADATVAGWVPFSLLGDGLTAYGYVLCNRILAG